MWVNNQDYPYADGKLFIGGYAANENQFYKIGLKTERHAITIAGAGSGKGVATIIPNLMMWKANALVVDPKGEAAEATCEIREKMGQSVYVIDPFDQANIPDKYRASLNPLDALDVNSKTILEDINVLADGIVMRGHDASASHWDDGAQTVIAGLIGFVLLRAKPENKNLLEVRKLIRNLDMFKLALNEMKDTEECAGICQAGAARALAKEGEYFVSNADKNTAWLDSAAMQDALASSSFSMSELKTGNASVYLVLPANYLGQHGRFLRLFVRHALEEMSKKTPDGKLRDKQCLFILDEFFSLGYIDEISKAAGLMRGYGLQLWPIMQDIGQLVTLYGQEGAHTFFGNADLHQFFGNTDKPTLEYMSQSTGTTQINEIPLPPSAPSVITAGSTPASGEGAFNDVLRMMDASSSQRVAEHNAQAQQEYQDSMNLYNRAISRAGKPRVELDDIAKMVQKSGDNVVARGMYCVLNGTDKMRCELMPYFMHSSPKVMHTPQAQNSAPQINISVKRMSLPLRASLWFLLIFALASTGASALIFSILGIPHSMGADLILNAVGALGIVMFADDMLAWLKRAFS